MARSREIRWIKLASRDVLDAIDTNRPSRTICGRKMGVKAEPVPFYMSYCQKCARKAKLALGSAPDSPEEPLDVITLDAEHKFGLSGVAPGVHISTLERPLLSLCKFALWPIDSRRAWRFEVCSTCYRRYVKRGGE